MLTDFVCLMLLTCLLGVQRSELSCECIRPSCASCQCRSDIQIFHVLRDAI